MATFSESMLLNTTLYVPKGCKGAYEKEDPWRNFWEIQETEFSGVDDAIADYTKTETGRYNLQGHQVTDDYKGVVIVKYSDGSTRKLIL